MPQRPARRPRRAARSPRSLARSVVAVAAGGLTALAAAVPAFAAGPGGVDVASFQHPNGAAINWSAVKRGGISFAYIKATENTNYFNDWFAKDYAGARAAGVYRGGYHFARPSAAAGSAAAQARYYVKINGLTHAAGDLPPMLDLEVSGGLSPAALVSWTKTWLSTVKSLTGRDPVIYTGPYFWRTAMANSTAFHDYPLFIASYGVSSPSIPGSWPFWTFWQSSSSGKVGGIIGSVDLDRFNGDAAGLARFANAAAPAPAPAPTPKPSPTSVPQVLPQRQVARDLTGDHRQDILARGRSGDLWTFGGNGRGDFSTQVHTGLFGWNAMDTVVLPGDLSGDGCPDVVARQRSNGQLFLYPGNGRGGLGGRRLIGTFRGTNGIVAAGDLNGDGRADLLVRDAGGHLWLYEGNGRGGWLGRLSMGTGWNGWDRIMGAGDLDGDGHDDVLARKASDGSLWLFSGNGAARWRSIHQVATGLRGYDSVLATGDMNSDGHGDLLLRRTSDHSMWLMSGNGRGGFAAPRRMPTSTHWGQFSLLS